jgi:hypothetical protein
LSNSSLVLADSADSHTEDLIGLVGIEQAERAGAKMDASRGKASHLRMGGLIHDNWPVGRAQTTLLQQYVSHRKNCESKT